MPAKKPHSDARLDRAVADSRRERERRECDYREQALRMYPWVCGRCGREFTRANVRELTVHHRDHDHDNNPPDGSNWELLCLYCHDNEHQRRLEGAGDAASGTRGDGPATYNPFADLGRMLRRED